MEGHTCVVSYIFDYHDACLVFSVVQQAEDLVLDMN